MATTHTPRHGGVPHLDQFIQYVGNSANPQDRYLIKHKGDKTFKYPEPRLTNLINARAFVERDRAPTNKVRSRSVAKSVLIRPVNAISRYVPTDLNDIIMNDGKRWYVIGSNGNPYPVDDNTIAGAFNYARKCRDVYNTTWPTNVNELKTFWMQHPPQPATASA